MRKALKLLILSCTCFLAAGTGVIDSQAALNLETDAPVAGVSVAINNYYASSLHPEEELATAFITGEGLGAWNGEPAVEAAGRNGEVPTVMSASGNRYDNVAISRVSNYVNVRGEANTTSDVVGKIYNNCAATILDTVEGEDGKWYQIQSGNVKGYIKAEYFITGSEAEKIARKVGTSFARVANTSTLRLREAPNLESKTLDLLSPEAEYEVIGEEGDFAKIAVDTDLVGYVFKDYIDIRVEFEQAVTLEEENAKAAEEARLKREAQEAMKALEEAKKAAAKEEAAAKAADAAAEEAFKEAEAARKAAEDASKAAEESKKAAESKAAEEGEAAEEEGPPQISAPGTGSAPGAGSESRESSAAVIAPGAAPSGSIEANPDGGNSKAEVVTLPETKAPETTETRAPQTTAASAPGTGKTGSSAAAGPGGGPGSAAVVSATRTAIVAYAKQFLGNPYVYGGTSLTNGTDCSGFTQGVYAHFGISTGRSSRDQAAKGREISVSSVQPGDLLFYASGNYINHVAMYIGNGQVIHASTSRTGIIISPSNYRTPCKAVTFLE